MALKGNLRDFSTAQLLNLINLARKTGTLTIEGSQVAQMSFREGKLIYASLGDNSNNLAYVLQDAGILSEEQGHVIQTRAKGTGDKQLGHLLIQAGYVTQSDIIQSVRTYILDVAYKMFTWAEGLFRFDANQIPSADRITVPIDLESVILEGSRRIKEWERLQEELPDLDVSLRFASRPNARLRDINLTVEEWRVVSFVSPENTVRQIAAAVNLNEFQIRRIVYGLLQVGLVELVGSVRPDATSDSSKTSESVDVSAGEQKPTVKRSVITRLITRIRRL
ncbi:MAG TPA: DUF4388 domain-containing protein [Patescibacteria group bacterium]|nr:DUF4388 domain-containing protein [Patescibacteria group bacterium]